MKIKEDKNGQLTLEITNNNKSFYLHSKYDVYKDAKRFASKFEKKSKDINILYGFGLGYHIKEILKVLKPNQKLFVLDLRKDIFELAKEKIDIKDILDDKRVELVIEDDYRILAKKISKYNISDNGVFFSYEPSINAIRKENIAFKNFFDSLKVQKNMILDKEQQNYIKENVECNTKLHDKNADVYVGEFKNIPGIIVSAGPSLDYVLPKLGKFKDKALIFSVGRALRSFDRYNFNPDMFMIIDSGPKMRTQIQGFENSDIPFIYLITANRATVEAYKGPRFVFYNDEIYSENNVIIETGGSVSTGVLNLMIKMGCNPIIFVGQDLGFYKEGTHNKDALYYNDQKPNEYMQFEKIKNVFSKNIYTTKTLISFKRFIEMVIYKNKHIKFINSSYNGASIEGAKYMDIDEVYKKYIDKKYKIREIINKNL